MSKKKAKKHEPEDQEVERKPFHFMDAYEWVWTGFEWIIPDLGHWWFGHLRNRVYKFNFDHYEEFGGLDGWCTIDHADRMILKCAGHPVFSISPDPMFLRKWLDTWVELHYCRLWQHVFDTLRLKKGADEFEASHRADVISSEFEQLFSPTWPRYPKVQKARRGSKRDKQMSKTLDQVVSELPADEQAKIAARVKELMPEEHIELRGPDPSPYTAFQYCYRVLDRRDIEVKLQNIPGSEGRFYEGVKVAAMVLGNDINSASNAANAAFNEIRRRIVYERLQVAGTPEKPPAEPAIDAAGQTET